MILSLYNNGYLVPRPFPIVFRRDRLSDSALLYSVRMQFIIKKSTTLQYKTLVLFAIDGNDFFNETAGPDDQLLKHRKGMVKKNQRKKDNTYLLEVVIYFLEKTAKLLACPVYLLVLRSGFWVLSFAFFVPKR